LVSLVPVAHAQVTPIPTLTVSPQSPFYIGDTVTLSCDLQPSTGGEFLWYKYNQQFQRVSLKAVSNKTVILTFHNSEDTVYQCGVQRHNSQKGDYIEYSDEFRITARVKPKPTVRVNPQSPYYTGDTVTLTCELQESIGWEFFWDKNNQLLQRLSTEPVNTNTLPVTVDNTGDTVYKCRARRRKAWTHTESYTEYSNGVRITTR
ncbi:Fc receptor-like protein 5 isoform X1, partial [Clarias magur]